MADVPKPVTRFILNSSSEHGSTTNKYVNQKWEQQKSFRTALPQILATMAKNLILVTYGLTLGFPTIVIPSLQNAPPESKLRLTEEEVSWFSSINFITVPLGCIVSGAVTQPFGRKRSMQVINIPFVIAWIMFYYSESVTMLYFSLALTGLAGGLLEAPVLTYVAEITQPHLRGILSATSSLAAIFGIFIQFIMGNFMDWRTLSAVNTIAPVLAFIALCFIPESPHWLIGKNRLEEAEKSLCWLRGWRKPEKIQEEYLELLKAIRPDLVPGNETILKKEKKEQEEGAKGCAANLNNYKQPTFVKPFVLVAFCFFVGHFSGMTTLTTYAVNVFSSMGAPVDKYFATMVLGIAQLSGVTCCVVLIHYTGKRPLVFASALGSGLFFCIVGFYAHFYLGVMKLDNGVFIQEHLGETSDTLSWVPMVCLIAASFFGFIAMRMIPWILIGEVYPPEVRGFASGLSGSVGYIFGFTANKSFFKFIEVLTLPGVYLYYGFVSLASIVVFYFFLPETEGWSLLEVQEHFQGTRNLVKAGKRKESICEPVGVENPALIDDQVSKL